CTHAHVNVINAGRRRWRCRLRWWWPVTTGEWASEEEGCARSGEVLSRLHIWQWTDGWDESVSLCSGLAVVCHISVLGVVSQWVRLATVHHCQWSSSQD